MADLEKIDHLPLEMAMPAEQVYARMRHVNKEGHRRVEHLPEFRQMPIAIVGGGPSLNTTFPDIGKFKKVMACGSVHDHLHKLYIKPDWVVVSDPDPIMAKYLTKSFGFGTRYLIASHCAQEVFDVVSDRDFAIWNCGDAKLSPEIWEHQGMVFGGGCTVLSRAIILALTFGFSDMHFFGCDTSITEDAHHAYDFATADEQLGVLAPIKVTPGGPTFMCAAYMLGQLFDLRNIISANSGRMKVTVHGGGLFAEMMAEANRRRLDAEERPDGPRDRPIPGGTAGE